MILELIFLIHSKTVMPNRGWQLFISVPLGLDKIGRGRGRGRGRDRGRGMG